MSSLTHRAEAKVVAAALAFGNAPLSTHEAFSHPGYRALYAAMLNVHRTHPELKDDDRLQLIAERAQVPGFDAHRLKELREEVPSTHVAAYARIVTTEAFRREVIVHAERIAQNAGEGDADPHTRRLADALARQSAILNETRDRGSQNSERTVTAKGHRAALEEAVLAGIIQYPEQAVTVARILPLESFTDPQRRAIAEQAISLASVGDPVDASIIAWELDRTRYLERLTRGVMPDMPQEPDEAVLHRLQTFPGVTADSSVAGAREILAADIHANLTSAPTVSAEPLSPTALAVDHLHRPIPPVQQGPRINGGAA